MRARLMNLSNRDVLLILFVLFAGGSLWSLGINLSKSDSNFAEWGESWLQNFSTEMFGAFLTFVLLTLVLGRRQEVERLVRRLRSQIPGEALRALGEIRDLGWFEDGTLQSMDLRGVNLLGVGLRGANLQGANLLECNFREANLQNANLKGAFLEHANLQGAILLGANLQGAILPGEDKFDETTVLPDALEVGWDDNGKLIYTPDSYYKPGITDMSKYTDLTHTDFWRSDDPGSPAYKYRLE